MTSASSSDAAKVRVDTWLWAIRVFRTRSAANEACRTGKVRIGDSIAKPAAKVGAHDEVFVKRGGHRLHLRVEAVLNKRVGASVASEYFTDLDPQPVVTASEPRTDTSSGVRERGAGRPTKRDRRQLDRLKGS